MPTVKISSESMALLISEARKLGVSVKDLLDAIVVEALTEEAEAEEEGEEEEEEEEAEEEGEEEEESEEEEEEEE